MAAGAPQFIHGTSFAVTAASTGRDHGHVDAAAAIHRRQEALLDGVPPTLPGKAGEASSSPPPQSRGTAAAAPTPLPPLTTIGAGAAPRSAAARTGPGAPGTGGGADRAGDGGGARHLHAREAGRSQPARAGAGAYAASNGTGATPRAGCWSAEAAAVSGASHSSSDSCDKISPSSTHCFPASTPTVLQRAFPRIGCTFDVIPFSPTEVANSSTGPGNAWPRAPAPSLDRQRPQAHTHDLASSSSAAAADAAGTMPPSGQYPVAQPLDRDERSHLGGGTEASRRREGASAASATVGHHGSLDAVRAGSGTAVAGGGAAVRAGKGVSSALHCAAGGTGLRTQDGPVQADCRGGLSRQGTMIAKVMQTPDLTCQDRPVPAHHHKLASSPTSAAAATTAGSPRPAPPRPSQPAVPIPARLRARSAPSSPAWCTTILFA